MQALKALFPIDSFQLMCDRTSGKDLFRFICGFTSRSTARVILRWVVYGWRNQCILVGEDSAL